MPTASTTKRQRQRVMSSIDTGTTFEIGSQSGHNVSNIGGNQTIYYGERTRAARIGKVLTALGLSLSLVGLTLLVFVGVTTAQAVLHAVHHGGVNGSGTQYLASGWPAAVGLLVGGFVVRRFARIIVGR
jgi:hypothetical protein